MIATLHRNLCEACQSKSMLFGDESMLFSKKACFSADEDCEQCGGSGLSARVLNLLFVGADATKAVALQGAHNRELHRLLAELRASLIASGSRDSEAGLRGTMMTLAARITNILGEG